MFIISNVSINKMFQMFAIFPMFKIFKIFSLFKGFNDYNVFNTSNVFNILNVFHISKVNVPSNGILLGCKGSASSRDILTLAEESVGQDLLGIMVWYVSVVDGLHYQVKVKNFLTFVRNLPRSWLVDPSEFLGLVTFFKFAFRNLPGFVFLNSK